MTADNPPKTISAALIDELDRIREERFQKTQAVPHLNAGQSAPTTN
jgi:hypothetical protein